MNLNNLEKILQFQKGKKSSLQKTINQLKRSIKVLEKRAKDTTKAKWVLTEVARITQDRFKEKVNDLVTLSVQSVFDRPFEFELQFVRQRNKFECVPIVREGDDEYVPKDDLGGSIIDLISFVFRVVLWSLQRAPDRSRPIFILDEPMKWVGKGETLRRAGHVLRELSHNLKFQLIIITHEPELARIADKAYTVQHNGEWSVVTEGVQKKVFIPWQEEEEDIT